MIKEHIFKSDSVELWILKESLLVMFPVKNSEPNNWNTCENNVVELVKLIVINCSAAEETLKTENPNRDYIKHVFVEHVGDKISVSSVSLSSMTE
jgi:hypothetical protein